MASTSSNVSISTDPTNRPVAALCASCDRCRSRKTKCDGNRPCGNCASRYMKKNRLTSIEGIDVSLFECVYSPAKRRGPVPGKSSAKRTDEREKFGGGAVGMSVDVNGGGLTANDGGGMNGVMNKAPWMRMDQLGGMMPPMFEGGSVMGGNENVLGSNMFSQYNVGNMNNGSGGMNDSFVFQPQQQLMQQSNNGMFSTNGGGDVMQQPNLAFQQQMQMMKQMQNSNAHNRIDSMDSAPPLTQRLRKEEAPPDNIGVEKSVTKHLSLLEKSSVFGNRLRSYYSLAVDTLFNLPPVPSDDEYCPKINSNTNNSTSLAPCDIAVLRAARFAEIALGALVSHQIPLALELSNAAVVCLKQCAEAPIHQSCMYHIAKAYFLHGMFRSYRGDMPRYFKYRRVCLAKLAQLDNNEVGGIEQLISAVAFHDSWAYMIYNANASDLPEIDDIIPQISSCGRPSLVTDAELKYNVSTDHRNIASDPNNQMWIQGTPPVFINNEAPPLSRALDALACAVRSCCDHANTRYDGSNETHGPNPSLTCRAVTANINELCSRNMVLSAFTLLQQSEASNGMEKNHGHHLLVSAMDAFLDGGERKDASGGITDAQIQSLLSVCNTIIEKPYLLYQGGITYHMVSNSAVLLCHLMNSIYAKRDVSSNKPLGDMEAALFDEVLDTFLAVRKLLHNHRRKIPVLLRCHGLPRPNLINLQRDRTPGSPFINLGETHMCASRSCQGFVLMACSPCVAAERAQAAERARQEQRNVLDDNDFGKDGEWDFDDGLNAVVDELDLDDEALLSILGKIVAA
eukprot:CAMPEP_0176480848 /NCGR_PEP_ID=MMETSP0200_2-20121128/2497_1 /TAXON_ID=947934 /ORGANISM="Chaetoceros sp., Strain GSL56" /LENGTH=794 /DNA_ID=CAMNT_0017876997 /DNA_START=322 /DNA_END=2706 /DNA_ORIENTATION=+